MASDYTQAKSTSDLLLASTEGDVAAVRQLYERYQTDGRRWAGESGPTGADVDGAYDRAFVEAMAESAQLSAGGPDAFGARLAELLGQTTIELPPDEPPAAVPTPTPIDEPAVTQRPTPIDESTAIPAPTEVDEPAAAPATLLDPTTKPRRSRLRALATGGAVIALGGVLVLVLWPRTGSPAETDRPGRRSEGAPTTLGPTEVMPAASQASASAGSPSAVGTEPVAESSGAGDRSATESPTAVFGTTSTTTGDEANG